ncbi:unnamed protein product [Lactuca saligna]|uniref:WD repeat-containing protein 44 n=1 Tax=Lactuca saligna TaxID=75948 RepID=A0AA36EHA7_LACSI|nr:unnamed protein product [Lactuca saligna]
MNSSCEEDEYRFFDAPDSVDSLPHPVSEPDEISHGDDDDNDDDDSVPNDFQYDIWANAPTSVLQRKHTFLRLMGLSSEEDDHILCNDTVDDNVVIREIEIDDRIMQTSGAVLRTPVVEDDEQQEKEESPVSSSNSAWCDDATCSSSTISRTEDSNGGGESKVEEEIGGKLLATTDIIPAPVVQNLTDRLKVAGTMVKTMNRVKGHFFGRLRSMTSRRSDSLALMPPPPPPPEPQWGKVQRVRVRQNKKRLKELSAVFIGQDIQAHEGSILTMKFSLDGRYLASAGEDMVVRVWQVVEDERSDETDIPDVDSSCLYFTVNNLSELTPLMADKEKEKEKQKLSRMKSMRKSKNLACVIFPPKIFRILEKPVHEFHGHTGHVLDLSWSNNNFLLSSSVDETVRLWRVGSDQCLRVFPHSNYVTCVAFQPSNQNYFISGSIDGKVRMWSVSKCQVVDWMDLREIVTAVAYTPDGKGGVIGSMNGCCSFFSLPENQFQMEESVYLNSKKKSQRIIGFQFYPQDPSKLMVICADSQVRILNGINVVGKFKGQRTSTNPICATFTSDGKHIVSSNEDSNVYIWNCYDQKGLSFDQNKTVTSYECFSANASVAVPWSGFAGGGGEVEDGWCRSLPPCYFSQYFTESIPKASATWPEEKLLAASPSQPPPPGMSKSLSKSLSMSMSMSMSTPLRKSDKKFVRSSSSCSYNCHTWGLVIVTAGWDGRIRSFLNHGLPATV